MNEGIRPSQGEVKIQATRAMDAINAVRKDYVARGYDLNHPPSEDVAVGAHVNLWIARDIARATAPYHALTRSGLLLQDISPGYFPRSTPYIVAGANNEGEGEVDIYLPNKNRPQVPLTGNMIDEALDQERSVPELALLFTRFSRRTPGSLLDGAAERISRSIRKGRLASVGFHIFGK